MIDVADLINIYINRDYESRSWVFRQNPSFRVVGNPNRGSRPRRLRTAADPKDCDRDWCFPPIASSFGHIVNG